MNLMWSQIKDGYHRYVEDYKRYLRLRGYGGHVNDWSFAKRAFITCWLAPGFHHFWRIWNPGISYFTYRLYLALGGREKRDLATVIAFVINGLVHNLVFNLFAGRWSDYPLPFTFFAFGVLAVTSRKIDAIVQLKRWPAILHLVINAGLVIGSFEFGFTINNSLRNWR